MEWIIEFITQYGMIAMFLFIALEYACLPLPSEVILPLSGAMAISSGKPLSLVIIISVIAGLLGSMICYSIGYSGGNAVLDRFMKRYPSTRKGIESTRRFYRKYAMISVGVGRLIPLFRTYISFMAGITKQHVTFFLLASSVGILVWNSLLITMGYLLAEQWTSIMAYYNQVKWFILGSAIVVVSLIGLKKLRQRKVGVIK
ncbi:MAG: DedA family protein [Turicibacter sp.]|nr:DedA family protein [Turicibacter sp.]